MERTRKCPRSAARVCVVRGVQHGHQRATDEPPPPTPTPAASTTPSRPPAPSPLHRLSNKLVESTLELIQKKRDSAALRFPVLDFPIVTTTGSVYDLRLAIRLIFNNAHSPEGAGQAAITGVIRDVLST